MKKLVLLIILLSLCGCSNISADRFAKFEHYTLSGEDTYNSTYTYIDDNGKNNIYVVTDITPKNSEMKINGLFYHLSGDDYILLDKIESGDPANSNVYSYDNKLYINACNSACHLEYTVDQEKFSKKQLKFDTSKISDHVDIYHVLKIDNGYIYWSARDYGSSNEYENWGKDLEIKCSLDTYKCELSEE